MTQGTLRLARGDDAAAFAAIYAPNVEGSTISFEVSAPTAAEMRERVATVQAYAPWLTCELAGSTSDGTSGGVAGYAYVSRHRERAAYQWSLDAAVYVRADQQRRGIARALYTTLFGLAKLHGYYAVHAGITLPNAAERRVARGARFSPGRGVPGGGLQGRGLARRGLVAARASATQRHPGAAASSRAGSRRVARRMVRVLRGWAAAAPLIRSRSR